MIQYKLIKTPEQYVIVSSETIEIGDKCFLSVEDFNEILIIHESVEKDFLGKKVIAQQNEIDFNGFENIVGYVDVEKLAAEYANKELNEEFTSKAGNFYGFSSSYIEGFEKSQELSSNKQFTLEDMEYCYNTAKRRAIMQEAGLEPDLGFNDYMSIYHRQPKEWLIEIQHVGNKVKITKIL